MLPNCSTDENNTISKYKAPHLYEPISEVLIRKFYQQLLKPGDSAIDIGVHYGIHLFPLSEAVGAEGHIVGIEASKERYEWLMGKIEDLDTRNIHLHNIAASNYEGTSLFHINVTCTGRSGIYDNRLNDSDEVLTTEVRCSTIDNILGNSVSPRFIKVDVEGAEPLVFVGARDTIAKNKPIILFEGDLHSNSAKIGIDNEELYSLFNGYVFLDLFGHEFPFQSWSRNGWNFIACPKKDLETVLLFLSQAWRNLISDPSAVPANLEQ
jgi:FkbM family methyltransferase